MKKKIVSFITVLILLMGLIGTIPVSAASVSLSSSKKTIYAGSFFQLKLKNASGNVTWKSNKESVAQVLPSGIVVALKKGKATITATYEGVAYGCTVTVKDPTIDKEKVTMRVDDSLRLKMKGANAVSWSSSDKKVATVDDGGLVKALMVGTTKITAKCEDGREYTSTVSVKNYDLKVGDTVKMGHYEQDNNTYNGAEIIEWEVLDVKDGKALLLSKNVLDYVYFSSCNRSDGKYKSGQTTWDASGVRVDLSSDFYMTAFSKNEKEKICYSVVTADLNPSNGISQGTATQDYVFLLSIKEVENYSPGKCKPSEYAIGKGAMTNEEGYTHYFLRTFGEKRSFGLGYDYCQSFVYPDGTISYLGSNSDYGCIRPAMWITID